MTLIDLTLQDQVAVMRLDHAVTNALSSELVQAMARALEQVSADPGIRALVLGSANDKFFSIGLDLRQLLELSERDFEAFYRRFNQTCLQLYTFHKPTVAAITGHAVAGGCVLALCCDYRVMGSGRKWIGLNETKLGVPVPYLAHCVLHSLVGARTARDVVEGGQFYPPEEALKMGMVDEVVALEQVRSRSAERARQLAAIPCKTYATIKDNRIAPTVERLRAHGEDKQRAFIDCWYAPPARERLEEALKNF